MNKKRVYVSSTYVDLAAHRAALKATLEKAQFDVECMEKYPAFDERPADKCLADVAQCDYYVLILAARYGFQPPDDNPNQTSITEMEYEQAVHSKKPCFVFLLDEDCSWPLKHADANPFEPESKIGAFRKRVGEKHGITLFTTSDSLATKVHEALRAHEQRNPPAAAASNAEVRERYLDWLKRECESVELLGLDLKESQNVRLGQVYVPAVTTPKIGEKKKGRQTEAERGGEPRHALLLHRLGEGSLYVPGAPGAGKSTFCRWVALAVANRAMPPHPIGTPEGFEEDLPASLRDRFPLLCRLREWAGQPACLAGNGNWTQAQLEDSLACWLAAAKPGGLTPEVMREELAQGRCLLILDGVDEIPERIGDHLPRRNLLSGLADARADWIKAGNHLLITSRPYGLDDADRSRLKLPLAELAELPDPLQETFVRRWYAAADPPRAAEKANGLLGHLEERSDLAELRRNPMLLTALCVKYDEGKRLPEDFYELYDSVTNQVLYKRYFDKRDRSRVCTRLEAVALGMHTGSRSQPRTTPAAEVSVDEVDRILADLTQTDPTTESGAADAVSRREDLLSNSGLLLPRSNKRAAFYHLTFQEFFAAVRIRRLRETETTEEWLSRYASNPAWRRALTLLFCAVADDSPESAANAYASLLTELEPSRLEANANPALLLADCLEIAHAREWNLDRFAPLLRQACRHALEHLAPPERAHLWRTLGVLGLDDRPGVGIKDGLPDIDWVEVPEGKFMYGDDKREISLPAFRIGRYPITNAQFQCFVEDGGYETDAWWEGLADRPEPAKPYWTTASLPRETVSWYEAAAFCRWLDTRLRDRGAIPEGWQVRLPTEQEWEKAARGSDGREFPWGEFKPGHANINETWDKAGPYPLDQTSAVGIYPQGASPCGALDMAGNVWEWCLNKYDEPDDASVGASASWTLRGGSWNFYRGLCHCACRPFGAHPNVRFDFVGFRVCCAPPII